MKIETIIVTVVVLIHHIIAFVHGGVHTELTILMALWQTSFINIVIVLIPLVGVVFLWTRHRKLGLYGVIVGMVGALLFGIVHHYMLVSPDHISHLPAAAAHIHAKFEWTAGAIVMLEGIVAALAAYFLGRGARDET